MFGVSWSLHVRSPQLSNPAAFGFKNWSLILWRFSLQGFGALGVWGVKSSDFTAAEKESGVSGLRAKGLGFRERPWTYGKTQVLEVAEVGALQMAHAVTRCEP